MKSERKNVIYSIKQSKRKHSQNLRQRIVRMKSTVGAKENRKKVQKNSRKTAKKAILRK